MKLDWFVRRSKYLKMMTRFVEHRIEAQDEKHSMEVQKTHLQQAADRDARAEPQWKIEDRLKEKYDVLLKESTDKKEQAEQEATEWKERYSQAMIALAAWEGKGKGNDGNQL